MRAAVAAFGLAVVIAVGAVGVGAARGATTSVIVRDNTFDPRTVTVRAGDDVVWTNNGTNPHTITADGQFDSHPTCPGNIATCMKPGETYTVNFGAPGTFTYYCKVHRGGGMIGTVVVEGQAPAATSTAPTTTTRPAPATTAPAATSTTTTSVLATTTSAADSTTSTTDIPFSDLGTTTTAAGELAAGEDGNGGGSGGQIALLIVAVLLSMALGAAAVWRFRPNRGALPPA